MAHGQEQQQRQQRGRHTGAEAQHQLGERLVAQDQLSEKADRQADSEQGKHGHPQWIAGERVEPKPPASREEHYGGNPGAQAGVHHERRQQVNLRPQQMADAAESGLPKHRQEGRPQDEHRLQPVHGNITHTSCSALRFAASFTRTSVREP